LSPMPRSSLRWLAAALVFASVLLAGCVWNSATAISARASTERATAACPAAWRAGWQALADEIDAPVYCPSWMPHPLDAKIGGPWFNGRYVERDRSYLVSFVWQETTPTGGDEVHVNFRAYPGQTGVPACDDLRRIRGKLVHKRIPCFADARGQRRIGGIRATVYTANQGADQWHVLYGWRHDGSLYTLSEHVAPPYTYRQVIRNLDRMVRGLSLIRPRSD
jgi:hypothetical protein